MASILKSTHFWDKQLLINWCTGIVLREGSDDFIVVWDEADQRFRLKRFRAFPMRAAERVVDHPERWPLLVKESGQELYPFEWEQLLMKGKLAIVHVYTEEQFRRLGAAPSRANEVPKDDRKRTAEALNPEEDGEPKKTARGRRSKRSSLPTTLTLTAVVPRTTALLRNRWTTALRTTRRRLRTTALRRRSLKRKRWTGRAFLFPLL